MVRAILPDFAVANLARKLESHPAQGSRQACYGIKFCSVIPHTLFTETLPKHTYLRHISPCHRHARNPKESRQVLPTIGRNKAREPSPPPVLTQRLNPCSFCSQLVHDVCTSLHLSAHDLPCLSSMPTQVDEGDAAGSGLKPEMLVSLTAPKLSARCDTWSSHKLLARCNSGRSSSPNNPHPHPR